MASRKTSTPQADLVLLPNLRNCLLNLPSALVAVLLNSNTVAQNVVVELSWRQTIAPPNADEKKKPAQVTKSVFLGWTGMQSQAKLAPMVGKDGIRGGPGRGGGGGSGGEQDVPTVEVDATFGRLLGLGEGMKVRVSLHARHGLGWIGADVGP